MMRMLLILLNLFFAGTSIGYAQATTLDQIENIKLNIKDHEMAVTFLGLSEGEATLIQGPNAENILVNIGGRDTGAELEGWLDLYNVKRLKALILTNDMAEYSSHQIKKLASKYNIKEIITTTKMKGQLLNQLSEEITVTNWNAGTKAAILPEVFAIVQYTGNEQNEGLDFMLEFFNHRIFLMSSYSERAEKALLEKKLENVNVFKLPHYAIEDTLSKSLIHSLNPEISVVFAAAGHQPNPAILNELHDTWSEIYYTKRHGTITIKFTETKYEVITIPVPED